MTDNWPFYDPKNVAVFTTKEVMNGAAPILFVSHDAEDGAWQFLSGSKPLDESDGKLVALHRIVTLDSSVRELGDLKLGWIATRKSSNDSWERQPKDSTEG